MYGSTTLSALATLRAYSPVLYVVVVDVGPQLAVPSQLEILPRGRVYEFLEGVLVEVQKAITACQSKSRNAWI
jgi:hypothetical protein